MHTGILFSLAVFFHFFRTVDWRAWHARLASLFGDIGISAMF